VGLRDANSKDLGLQYYPTRVACKPTLSGAKLVPISLYILFALEVVLKLLSCAMPYKIVTITHFLNFATTEHVCG
jgi:hypothetical protein